MTDTRTWLQLEHRAKPADYKVHGHIQAHKMQADFCQILAVRQHVDYKTSLINASVCDGLTDWTELTETERTTNNNKKEMSYWLTEIHEYETMSSCLPQLLCAVEVTQQIRGEIKM